MFARNSQQPQPRRSSLLRIRNLALLALLLLLPSLASAQRVTAGRIVSGVGAPTADCNPGPPVSDLYFRTDTLQLYACAAAPNTWTLVTGGGGGGGLADPGSNAIIKRTALNVTAPAIAGTDYVAPTGSGAGLTGITLTQVTGDLAASRVDDGGVAATQALFSGAGGAAGFRAIADADVPDTITLTAFSQIGGAVTDAQVPDTITLSNITQITSRAISDTSGDLAASRVDDGGVAATQALFSGAGSAAGFRAIADADIPDTITLTAFSQIGGSVTDAQVPDTITIDLATVATTANAGDSATLFFTTGTIEPARLGSGSGGATKFLREDSTWQTVSGSGDVTAAAVFGTDNVLIRSDGTSKGVQNTGITVADTTNDLTSPGNAVFGSGSSEAGLIGIGQGTAQATITSTIGLTAPTSVTAYNFLFPGAAGDGVLLWANSSNIVTGTFTATTGTGSFVRATAPTIAGSTLTGTHDASAAVFELPNGTAPVAGDCDAAGEAGRIFIDTNATTGQQVYVCEGTTGWVLQGDGGGGGGANTALSNLASVAINTTLVSDTDNTDDLGTSSIAWKDLYLKGTANFGGSNSLYIQFNEGSATSAVANTAILTGAADFPAGGLVYIWPSDTPTTGEQLTASISGTTVTMSWDAAGSGGGGAPTDATYITQTANGTLSAEQALSSLSTGLMVVTTSTGVITSITDSAGLDTNISDDTGTGALVFGTNPTIATPTINGAATWEDNTRQTFNPGNTQPGLNVGENSADPSSLLNADIWYDGTNHTFDVRANGATQSLAFVSQLPAAASETVAGIIEIATTAEINTGTDATRAVAPDQFAASNFGTRVAQMVPFDFTVDTATGDGKFYFVVPEELNGMVLVGVRAQVVTAGTTNATNVDLARCATAATGNACSGTVVDMLSTNITIDSGENSTDTAATPAVIDTANDDVATGQIIRVDVDAVSTTPAKGLLVTMKFRLP